MCGIAGIVWKSDQRDNSKIGVDIVKEMLNDLSHRGPDGNGIYSNSKFTIGHARLAIIDIEGGKQPLKNKDNKVKYLI